MKLIYIYLNNAKIDGNHSCIIYLMWFRIEKIKTSFVYTLI